MEELRKTFSQSVKGKTGLMFAAGSVLSFAVYRDTSSIFSTILLC